MTCWKLVQCIIYPGSHRSLRFNLIHVRIKVKMPSKSLRINQKQADDFSPHLGPTAMGGGVQNSIGNFSFLVTLNTIFLNYLHPNHRVGVGTAGNCPVLNILIFSFMLSFMFTI